MRPTRFAIAVAAALLVAPAVAFAESSSAGDAAAAAGAGIGFAIFGVVMLVFYVLVPVVFIALIVFWVFALVDVATRNEWEFPNAMQGRPGANDKLLWLLVVILASYVGAAVYYFVVMRQFPLKAIRAARAAGQPPACAAPPVPSAPAAPPTEPPRSDLPSDS